MFHQNAKNIYDIINISVFAEQTLLYKENILDLEFLPNTDFKK